MKVLNLYAGVGGNRKMWEDVEVTAIEINKSIARLYKKHFPQDRVLVADAHKYLLNHFHEFDFIWASPPCPSHSRIRRFVAVERGQNKPIYPDMNLWQEIIFLENHFKGKWVVENVKTYYKPLITPQELGNHYFWANFIIGKVKSKSREHNSRLQTLQERKGFDISDYKGDVAKKKILRNCVEPEVGLHVLNSAFKEKQQRLFG